MTRHFGITDPLECLKRLIMLKLLGVLRGIAVGSRNVQPSVTEMLS